MRADRFSPAALVLRGVDALAPTLDAQGFSVLPGLLSAAQCTALAAIYDDPAQFRSRNDMTRYRFGRGVYRYFVYPLPELIASLRAALYVPLAVIANSWQARLGDHTCFLPDHADLLARCHAAGQRRPTPLLLRCGSGDFNSLHQDLYGEHVFPLQQAILPSRPDADFRGRESVLTEQRPRA